LRWAETTRQIARFIRDLDSDHFATRQKATRALESLGDFARPLLEQSLSAVRSLEQRRRLEGILAKVGKPFPSPAGLRLLRIVEVFGHAGTTEARAALEQLARHPTWAVAMEARRILHRLEKR
jgi:hypothetical protein